jgi:hypothetical protein
MSQTEDIKNGLGENVFVHENTKLVDVSKTEEIQGHIRDESTKRLIGKSVYLDNPTLAELDKVRDYIYRERLGVDVDIKTTIHFLFSFWNRTLPPEQM